MRHGSPGFSLLTALVLMMVLGILGMVTYRQVNGDIRYAGRDLRRVKAEYLAQTAVQWALGALARPSDTLLVKPFTAGTHRKDGSTPLPDRVEGMTNYLRIQAGDLSRILPGRPMRDEEGWFIVRNRNPATSLTGATEEVLSFKVWYPSGTMVRISGRGRADGVSSTLEMVGDIETLIP
ncbi:MAG TPA: hypothetical protein VJ385_06260 [Fibrobacteria bacterium]|nr:hypothetical protein [Fibrobacteria bacterium]